MAYKISKTTLPATSSIQNFIATNDYQDAYSVRLQNMDLSIEKIYLNVFAHSPKWINTLLKLRNRIVQPFGVKTHAEKIKNEPLAIGKKTGMFNIFAITSNEIIAGDDEIHLNYRVSVMKHNHTLTISTLVQYNNWLGKFYFFIVKAFHKMAIKSILKNALKNNRI